MHTDKKINNFTVFILTNRRPNNVKTIKTLRDGGYTGPITLVLDDEDETKSEYEKNYPELEIICFSKRYAMEITDSADNTDNPKAVVYARNMCHEIARDLKKDYFLVLDDDYTEFDYTSNENNQFYRSRVKSLDKIFELFLEFLENSKADTICFAQGGDFFGGAYGNYGENILLTRKAMNSFFCKTDRPFNFYGLINEDVNMYVLNGSRGKLNFTSSLIQLNQTTTQKNEGGLTTIYLEQGTYVKSFYSVMYHPSSVVVTEMGGSNKRLHHSIKSDFTYPKILREEK